MAGLPWVGSRHTLARSSPGNSSTSRWYELHSVLSKPLRLSLLMLPRVSRMSSMGRLPWDCFLPRGRHRQAHDSLPRPSSTVTMASPPDAWAEISSPWSKEKSVMLTRSFCTRVLLTTCPGWYCTRSLSCRTTCLGRFLYMLFPSGCTDAARRTVKQSVAGRSSNHPGHC